MTTFFVLSFFNWIKKKTHIPKEYFEKHGKKLIIYEVWFYSFYSLKKWWNKWYYVKYNKTLLTKTTERYKLHKLESSTSKRLILYLTKDLFYQFLKLTIATWYLKETVALFTTVNEKRHLQFADETYDRLIIIWGKVYR